MANATSDSATAATFRSKAAFMKSWNPENAPSNRDRLELYALHKQAVSGDAPPSLPSNATVADKAKYQAWKTKRGLTQEQAMSQYIAECDRQIRVYAGGSNNNGATPRTPPPTPQVDDSVDSNAATPRGLAAIPLLCAAAAESRVAYVRRLAQTTPETSWWSRQEPLCAPPGTLLALPETLLIAIASLVEYVSLIPSSTTSLVPPSVIQSFLWPVHNCLLSLWMGLLLIHTSVGVAMALMSTVLWGARRTGLSLSTLWRKEVHPCAQAVHSMCEPHQAMSTRLVGLALWPYETLEGCSEWLLTKSILGASGLYVILMGLTWWYWLLVVPWLGSCLLGAAAMSGICFALIDLAGV